ncbi:MAG: hypothetical protein WAM14_18585 [Candidatus Nitrosopolaris sp.]
MNVFNICFSGEYYIFLEGRQGDMFVKAYNYKREHGGINGLTPFEMFLQTFNRSHSRNNTKQKSVTYVGI